MTRAARRIGDYCSISPNAYIGTDVTIGNRVTIYPGVRIEEGTTVLDGSVLGRLTVRTPSVHRASAPTFKETRIGPNSVIGCNCVLYTGMRLGAACLLADGVSVREDCAIDDNVLLGRYVTLNYGAKIGRRSKVMDFTHITGNAVVGEDCFISIHVATTNDNDVYLGRFGLADTTSNDFAGPIIGHYAVIGAGAILNPGVRVGDGAIVASGAVVTRSLPPWVVAMGTPARVSQQVPVGSREKIEALASQRGQTLQPPSDQP